MVYAFTLSQEKKVDITVAPAIGSGLKPVVYLQRTTCATGVEVACNAKSTVANAALSVPFLAAGSYFVIVDSYAPTVADTYHYPAMSLQTVCGSTRTSDEVVCARRAASGAGLTMAATLPEGTCYLWVDQTDTYSYDAFTLTLDLVAYSPPPANDVCASADALGTLAPTGTVTRTGSTTWAVNDYQPAGCAASLTTGGDLTYSFTLSQPAMLTARVTRDATATGYKPAVYLQRYCGGTAPGDLVICNAVSTATAQVQAQTLGAGTYYLIVDGTDGTGGLFTLEVTTAAAVSRPENCASPVALTFDASGHAQAHGDTTNFLNDTTCSTTCYSSGAVVPDLVYLIDTTSLGAKDLSAAIALGTSAFYASVLSLRTDCAVVSSELACKYYYGSSNQMAKAGLAPGIYYLWVAGSSATYKGVFDLTVDLYDPPPAVPSNNLCASAQPLAFDPVTGDVRIRSATVGGTGDPMSGSCATMSGPEVVYTFTTRAAGSLYAAVSRDPLSPTYEPTLHVRTSCPSTGLTDETACATQTSGVALLNKALAAGTYYLVVDGTNNTSGRFDLYVSVLDAVTNDDCPTAKPLVFDPITGVSLLRSTTSLATNNTTSNSCNSTGTGYEVVYQLDIPAGPAKDVTAELSPLLYSKFDGVVSMRSTCDTKSTELGCNYTSSANTKVSWKWPNLATGTYYLWVDSYSSST